MQNSLDVLPAILIADNVFDQNWAGHFGGAVAMEGRPAVIEFNTFTGNQMRDDLLLLGDFCDEELSWGGGAVSLVDCDYNITRLSNNTYVENLSDNHGGAIYVNNSTARMTSEQVFQNQSFCIGGGIYSGEGSNTSIIDCDISDGNLALQHGGGVGYVDAGVSHLLDSVLVENEVNGDASFGGGFGGAVYSRNTSPYLADLLIDRNGTNFSGDNWTPRHGGGVAFIGGSPLVERCEIIRNHSAGDGGGIYAFDVDTELSGTGFQVLNCIVGANVAFGDVVNGTVDSKGAAIWVSYADSAAALPLSSNTVTWNRALGLGNGTFGGIYIASANQVDAENCIIWNNKNGYNPITQQTAGSNQTFGGLGSGQVTYTDIKESSPGVVGTHTMGTGSITATPSFFNATQANFRLRWNTPCKNVGNNLAQFISSGDIDDMVRILGGTIDMGADEMAGAVGLPPQL